jgi:hypothetical protein
MSQTATHLERPLDSIDSIDSIEFQKLPVIAILCDIMSERTSKEPRLFIKILGITQHTDCTHHTSNGIEAKVACTHLSQSSHIPQHLLQTMCQCSVGIHYLSYCTTGSGCPSQPDRQPQLVLPVHRPHLQLWPDRPQSSDSCMLAHIKHSHAECIC